MANPTFDIRRPNGNIETVEVTRVSRITTRFFALAQTATRKAGRGEILSYSNPGTVRARKPHVGDICPQCGTRCYGDCTA